MNQETNQPTETRQPGQPWSFDDAASFLGISKRHLERQVQADKIKAITLGKRRLIPDAEMQRVAQYGTN